MAKLRIIVRYDGAGWIVCCDLAIPDSAARPYAQRDEAVADALFARRMLDAMGHETEVLVEGPGGIHAIEATEEHIWRRH